MECIFPSTRQSVLKFNSKSRLSEIYSSLVNVRLLERKITMTRTFAKYHRYMDIIVVSTLHSNMSQVDHFRQAGDPLKPLTTSKKWY